MDDTPTNDKPMTDDELLQRLGASTDRIEALEAELKAIRDEEAALQARKSTALAKVKTEREQRERMLREAATVRKIKRSLSQGRPRSTGPTCTRFSTGPTHLPTRQPSKAEFRENG